MPFARGDMTPSRRSRGVSLVGPTNDQRRGAYWTPPGYGGRQPYRDGWDLQRAVERGFNGSPWVWRAINAIANNQAKLPIICREGNRVDGAIVTPGNPETLRRLNYSASPNEPALLFRKRISEILLLNPQGVMIEVVRNRRGEPLAFYILPPGQTFPIPDATKFVSAYRVWWTSVGYVDIPAEDVVWIRDPHPIHPYRGITPLEAAGLSIESDYYARLYNRNFLVNDMRPGGALVIKGEMDPDDQAEVMSRFSGGTGAAGYAGAGRLTVIAAEQGAEFVDFSTSARDMQYVEMHRATKDEILMAFGVPESVAGNASGRTFDNADAEYEVFWRETEIPHLDLMAVPFDRLLDDDPEHFTAFDFGRVPVLERDKRNREQYALTELQAGARAVDEYRELVGLARVGASKLNGPMGPVADVDRPYEDVSGQSGGGFGGGFGGGWSGGWPSTDQPADPAAATGDDPAADGTGDAMGALGKMLVTALGNKGLAELLAGLVSAGHTEPAADVVATAARLVSPPVQAKALPERTGPIGYVDRTSEPIFDIGIKRARTAAEQAEYDQGWSNYRRNREFFAEQNTRSEARDGDGDGMVNDGKPGEGPAVPRFHAPSVPLSTVPESVSKLRDRMVSWPQSKPWEMSIEDSRMQRHDGFVHGERQHRAEAASYEPNGKIRLTPGFWRQGDFDMPIEARKAIVYHEAGHGLVDSFTSDDFRAMGIDSVADVESWPNARKISYNGDEILSEAYSMLWSDEGRSWFDRVGAPEVGDLAIAMAKLRGFPLPKAIG